tara:strand:+ start:22904 stop:23092 length:189 start_codon:yes stop_codon:yes gene_type:complete
MPKININGKVTFIKLGIKKEDNIIISRYFTCTILIIVNNLDVCNNHAIDIKIKKISVQDLNN